MQANRYDDKAVGTLQEREKDSIFATHDTESLQKPKACNLWNSNYMKGTPSLPVLVRAPMYARQRFDNVSNRPTSRDWRATWKAHDLIPTDVKQQQYLKSCNNDKQRQLLPAYVCYPALGVAELEFCREFTGGVAAPPPD